MGTDTPINDVSDTSFWVAYYRAQETERSDSMFKDPFAKFLIGDRGKKISDGMAEISRYTAWSVTSRTVMIDRFIEKLVREGVDAVVNLGAGLDARPYRMNLPENLEWVEVDYPHIIRHKSEVLKNERPKCKLTKIEADLADSKKRKEALGSVVPQAKKVLILTEGVLPYLSPEQVSELSADLLAQKRFTYWIAEYFDPRVYPYLKKTVRELKMRNAPFKFYPEDWFGFFKNLGWIKKEIAFTGDIAMEFRRRPPMPRWIAFIMPIIPKRVRDEMGRMNGYVIFERANS